jgi:hypothetical protein
MMNSEELRGKLSRAEAEALRVGDSPLRADQLALQIDRIVSALPSVQLGEESRTRIDAHLRDALRVLRRDDDGREAAKHLQAAGRQLGPAPRRPSPFLDD